MARLVALLRAVNVAGHHPMRMDRLAALSWGLGLREVATYLQSGNVVFNAESCDLAELRRRLEAAIRETFGFEVAVLVRSAEQLARILTANPFPVPAAEDPRRVHVTFLGDAPGRDAIARLAARSYEPDEVRVIGSEAYLHFPNGSAHTKLSPAYMERVLRTTSTTRNWNTVMHLAAMAHERRG